MCLFIMVKRRAPLWQPYAEPNPTSKKLKKIPCSEFIPSLEESLERSLKIQTLNIVKYYNKYGGEFQNSRLT